MFTGLIREFAHVMSYQNNVLRLRAKYRPNIGDSIAINGACLTVIRLFEDGFSVELSPESREHLAMENYQGQVHIEPAMQLSDRLDGHMVQGHVDCIGVIESLVQKENGLDIVVALPKEFIKFVIPKGSITIDGVSLTVNDVFSASFRLTIIPHTLEKTLIRSYKIGRRVNIETDMFARYVYHLFKKEKTLDWESVDRIMATY
jgi:riboflavin synthase